MTIVRLAPGALLIFMLNLVPNTAPAQPYPYRPIRIVDSEAGGGGDFIARQLAQAVAGPLGQPVIVDNRGGGFIPAEFTAKAAPDGYTVMIKGGSLWIAQLLQKTPYDVDRDFVPISLLVREVSVVAVHPSVPVKSVKELIAYAKAKPGELNYSSSQAGGTPHLAVELFKSMAGLNIVWVPYKGNAAAVTALLGGEVQMTIIDTGLIAPHAKLGKLRALAVTSADPSLLAPGLPTIAVSGVPGYESSSVTGLFAPTKTPAPIIARLNQEFLRALNTPEVKERLLAAGVEVVGSSPEQFAAAIKADLAKWGKVIKEAGIKGH